jgi:hypothetical protein
MYARFLLEAMDITGMKALGEVASLFVDAGNTFSEIGRMFQDAQTMSNLDEAITIASEKFKEIAAREEQAYTYLKETLPSDEKGE